MRVYYGDKIKNIIDNERLRSYKKRYLMPELVGYLNGKNDGKVMVLCGLRRTGKNTMMQQAIVDHIGTNNAMYIQCHSNDAANDIADVILESNKKYIFLDEVTKVPDFINMASAFSDDAAFAGYKIVMVGTDSLGFTLAKNDELFDRMHEIRTTYIPFSEYSDLTGKDLFEYMKYGGTLGEENYFYNEDSIEEYTNSAIIDNILHTYEHWDQGKHKIDFYPAKSAEDIRFLVNYYVCEETKRFLTENLKTFKDGEFHLRYEKLTAEWQRMLQIKDEYAFEVTEGLLTEIRETLISLDVLTCVKNGKNEYLYYFTQPGLRYCHIQTAIDTLAQNEKVRNEYSKADIDAVTDKIREDIEGRLLEDIVFLDMKKRFADNRDISVRKFSQGSAEYDVIVTNSSIGKSVVFEVKRSGQMLKEQKKHLENAEFQHTFERLTSTEAASKAVLYSGKTGKDREGFQYINTSDFLKNVSDNLNMLCSCFIRSET